VRELSAQIRFSLLSFFVSSGTLAQVKKTMPLSTQLPSGTVSIEKEWEVLRLCASPLAMAALISQALAASFDWEVLLELGEEHGVLGVLATRLGECDFSAVPAIAREKLQARMRAQHFFTLSMTAELFRILQDFSTCGIECVLVKGPLVSLLAYQDPAVRSYVDLDLLVRHADILSASRRMIELGFAPDLPLNVIEAGKIPGEYFFKRPGTSQIVELHTERTFRYYPRPMPLAALLARKRTVSLDGRGISALSLEDEFVLNCIHGAKHFWERLMWVADIAAIMARHPEIDWNCVRQASEDVGAGRMLRVALQLAQTVLGVPVPGPMTEEVRRDKTASQLCRKVESWLPSAGYDPPILKERAIFRMRMRGGLAGVAYLVRLSFSPTEEDWAEGAEERRSGFWDALQRPLRLFRKYRSNNP
jgi:hypothetical protein